MTQVTNQSPAPAAAIEPASSKPSAKPRGRWAMRLLMIGGCCLGLAIWFAPMIVAETALKQQVPRLLFPLYPGTVEIGSASLGWLQPVVVHDLRAEDAEGNPFLEVKEFSTSEPLWKLAVSQANLGRLILVEPKVAVAFRPDGSNLEDILEKMMSGPPSSAPPADFELEVKDATLTLDHKVASLSSTISPVSLVMQLKRGAVEEFETTIGEVPSADEPSLQPPTNWLAFRFGNEPTQDGVAMAPGSKHIRLKATAWSLEPLRPALARFEPDSELSGEIDADIRSQVNLAELQTDWTTSEWSWDGRVTARKLVLAGLSMLNKDRVQLETTSLAGRLAAQQGRLSMDQAQLETEFGEVTASGDISLAGLGTAAAINSVQSILGDQDYVIHGHLDLQRLAALLPSTLRIHEGTEITGGRVDVNLKSESSQGDSRSWTADATLDGLSGRNHGAAIALEQPLQLAMQAHRTGDAITVDKVNCQSDFLNLTGRGTLTDAQFSATGDLTRLEETLQRFIDLGLARIAGKIKVQGQIQRGDNDHVSLATVVQLDGFRWDLSKTTSWQEPQLILNVEATAETESGTSIKSLDSAELKLSSGHDTLVATLQQPVDFHSADRRWPITATLQGDMHTWQNRLSPFVAFPGWQLGGTALIDVAATADSKSIEVGHLNANVTNLDARHPDWWIKEPQVKLETAGHWSIAQSEWNAKQTTLTATAIACRINELVVGLKPDGQVERVTGDAAYRGDLDKLSRWKNQALERPSYHVMGTFEGRTHLIEQDSVISLDLDATVTKLVFADLETLPNQQLHWVALWREPELHIIGKGRYDIATDQLQMENAAVEADGLALNVHGSLAQLSTTQLIDIKGELDYDWAIVGQRMGDSLKNKVQLTGKQKRPLALKGSLTSLANAGGTGSNGGALGAVDIAGNAAVGWDSAVIEGLNIGATDISARLEKGVCQFSPIETTVADGKLHLTPQVRFDRSPALLLLPAEKVIDRVQITPQLCDSWLKYVAPLMADATQIDGQFSLDVNGGTLPIAAPMSGEMAASLGVHHVQVRPGGAALQVMGMVDQIKSLIQRKPVGNGPRDRIWMQMPEQSIPFKLTGGRVYHQGVTFKIGDGIVQSSGSVGMDETIDLVLQIPILDEWANDQKLLAGLKGKTLKIPVRGSLSRPQFDSRVLTELATQIGGTALEGAIEDKLDDLFKKKLNKFLPGQD